MSFVNFKRCCSDSKQFIRLVVLVICICVSCYQLAGCFRKINYPPISTHYGFHLDDKLRYPAVTICRSPPYKTELFGKYGFEHEEIHYATAWKSFKYDKYTLQQFFEETTYNYSEITKFSAHDGKLNNFNLTSFFTFNYGRCFTIRPINDSENWGTKFGYFFYFSHTTTEDSTQRDMLGGSAPGFHIFIHEELEIFSEKSQQSDIFREYLYVEAGDSLQINLRMSKYSQLPTSNNNCNPDWNYKKSKCEEDFVNKRLTSDVGCNSPWIPNEKLSSCNSYEQVRKMIEYSTESTYLTNYLKESYCPSSCNTTNYMPFVQSIRQMSLPDSTLRIYFSSNLYTQMEEVIGYDWNNFLADLGGSLGFLLGLSVLGTIALVEQLIATIIKIRESRKANGQLNNNDDTSKNATGDNIIETKNDLVSENDNAVNCKNKVNEYKADFEFYAKKGE